MSRFNYFYKRFRMCVKCEKPIRLHDKYTYIMDRGERIYRHRHCDNPRSYEKDA